MSTETNEFPNDEISGRQEHPRSVLAAFALGALDPDEVELVTRHVQSCPSCRAELAEYDAVVVALPYSVQPQPVPIRARAGLLARLDEIGTSNSHQMIVLPTIPREDRISRRWLRVSATPRMVAFAAVPLVLILAIVGIMADVINDQQQQIASIESEKAAEAAAVDKVFLGTDGGEAPAEATFINSTTAPETRAKLIVNYDTNSALILARNLPAPADGLQYVAWLTLTTPGEYAHAGILQVDDEGRGSLSVEPHDAIQNYNEVIVTLESDPEATAPTGPQVMTAALVPAD